MALVTLVGTFNNAESDLLSSGSITLTPNVAPIVYSGSIYTGDPITKQLDLNGAVTFSSVVPGGYELAVNNSFNLLITTMSLFVSSSLSGTVNIAYCLTTTSASQTVYQIQDLSGYQKIIITGSSFNITASNAVSVTSASYAGTASVLLGTAPSATQAISASWASSSLSSSYSISASYAMNANLAYGINFVPATATSASWVSASATINTASYATNAGNAFSGSVNVTSASGVYYLDFSPNTGSNQPSFVTTSITVNPASGSIQANSVTASLSGTSSFATTAQTAYAANTASYISSSATFDVSTYNHTASFAITSSVSTKELITALGGNNPSHILFAGSNAGYNSIFADTGGHILYNPGSQSLTVTNITASLWGTASWAQSASFITASNVQGALSTAQVSYTTNQTAFTGSFSGSVQGPQAAAAWANFSIFGTTITTNRHFNVPTINRLGAGLYRFGFNAAIPQPYAVIASAASAS